MPGFSKRLVIDARVARASGGTEARHPTSRQCRDFLQTVLQVSHRIVMTSDIRTEWNKHRSGFASTWLVTMQRKGKMVHLEVGEDAELRSKIETYAGSAGLNIDGLLKDLHLLEAALKADEVVVSNENYCRKHFGDAARGTVPEIARVAWVNPCAKVEEPLTWLKGGARSDQRRRLGYDE